LGETERNNKWFALARKEIRNAKISFKYGADNKVICFRCHQAVEKCFKGYLFYMTGELQEEHNLLRLCKKAMSVELSFDGLMEDLTFLNKYYLENQDGADAEFLITTKEETIKCFEIVKKVVAKIENLTNSIR
jgi:HEPN domain-containing protein